MGMGGGASRKASRRTAFSLKSLTICANDAFSSGENISSSMTDGAVAPLVATTRCGGGLGGGRGKFG